MMRIALIGCGAIGSALLELIQGAADIQVAAVVLPEQGRTDRTLDQVRRLAPDAQVVAAVPDQGIDLVVEAAGHAAIEAHVLPALQRGVPAIVASVGALSAQGLPERLESAARSGGTQIQLIAGAIGAIDALAAARIGGLDQVCYIGRKPPHAWNDTPASEACDLSALVSETVIFEGTAREAATLYPKNANVAATVSLAGLGLDQTRVRLIADPAVHENVHRIEAEGAFGRFELTMRNRALATNPKTSALTAYSAARALLGRVAPLII